MMERLRLEDLLRMEQGYVLGFSNASFQRFVMASTGRNIYDAKYKAHGDSKAKLLRAFWKIEENYVVAKLLVDLLGEILKHDQQASTRELYKEAERIIQRLRQGGVVVEAESIAPIDDSREFEALVKSVRDAINNNEPEMGLDRLHTYTVKMLRVFCQKHGIAVDQSKPLHSLMGEYRKKLVAEKLIESEMTNQILATTISVFKEYHEVRNNKSYAHDNRVLGYEESLLILNTVSSLIRFLRSLEDHIDRQKTPAPTAAPEPDQDDIPF